MLTNQSPASSFFVVQERDLLAELLADKRSPNTRKAYQRDLRDFFKSISGQEVSPQLVREFLGLERATAIALVLQYKAGLIDRKLAEATVNRRLAAIKSLVAYAQKADKCSWSLEAIAGEKIRSYRDTTGVDAASYRKILETCDRLTYAGLRDYAILRLLWDNVLRRGEVASLNVGSFDRELRRLSILGKGRGTQAESVSLSQPTTEAIDAWLISRGRCQPPDPLFIALDRAHRGHRLSAEAIYRLVRDRASDAGISKIMSPHRIRHSGITAALDATNGNVREVKKLSRHAKIDTLLIYDDNRINHQAALTDLLGGMVG